MLPDDGPLVTSYGGGEVELAANGAKVSRNSRMSTLLFWQGRGNKGANGTQNGKNWIHTPDTLIKGHVAYLVKFLGVTPVTEPKGIEVVQEAIKKLQFTQQLKKSETKDGAKCKKVEITISVDGVAIQVPKSNNILRQFPLHRISYCADDKGEKKYFSFIAKPGFSIDDIINNEENPETEEKYECFVFTSTKLASEITLTIGQAFDLAYRRFMTDNSKIVEIKKLTLLNRKLSLQMNAYKKRLQELSKVTYKDDLASYLSKNNLSDICEYKVPEDLKQQFSTFVLMSGMRVNGATPDVSELLEDNPELSKNMNNEVSAHNLLMDTPTSQRNGKVNGSANGKQKEVKESKNPIVGTKLEGLLLESDSDSDFDPRAFEAETPAYMVSPSFPPSHAVENNTVPPPLLAPPPKATKRQQFPQTNGSDLFGSTPFSLPVPPVRTQNEAPTPNKPNYDISDFNLQTSVFNTNTSFTNGLTYDPFDTQKGGNIFGTNFGNFNGFGNLSEKQNVELDSGFNGFLDKRISEMKDGFSRGISFGNDDFSIDQLDPLKKN